MTSHKWRVVECDPIERNLLWRCDRCGSAGWSHGVPGPSIRDPGVTCMEHLSLDENGFIAEVWRLDFRSDCNEAVAEGVLGS